MRKFFPNAPLVSLILLLVYVYAGCNAVRRDRGALSVGARLKNGDAPRPIRQETLYLLDADLIRLAMNEVDAGNDMQAKARHEHTRLKLLAGLMNGRRFAAYPLGPDIKLLVEQSKPLWQQHVVRTARTDDEGRAVFEKLGPGDYWLMCLSERDGKLAFWNPRVTIGSGPQVLLLDESNALTVSDAPDAR